MSLTESTMMKLGTEMPDFALLNVVNGKEVSSEDYEDAKAICVMFISAHCPYVRHVADELSKIGQYYDGSGLEIVAISSNDVENYPEDGPAGMCEMAEDYEFPFPILYDQKQEVAADFMAACTPDFFLFAPSVDVQGRFALMYRGQLDDSRPENGKPVTGADLRAAIDAILAGKKPEVAQKPSSGCGIKWKAGNEPLYNG